MSDPVETRIMDAYDKLMTDYPSFHIPAHLDLGTGEGISSIASDGKTIIYNRDFIEKVKHAGAFIRDWERRSAYSS